MPLTIGTISSALTDKDKTSLLLRGNSSNSVSPTTAIVDSSNNRFAITTQGSPTGVLTPSPNPAQTGSIYFNGSSVLKIAHNSNLTFGNTDFTIEMWCYFTSAPASGTLYSKRPSTTAGGGYCGVVIGTSSGKFSLNISFNGTSWGISNQSMTVDVNAWQHLALVRSGNTFTFYKNGSAVYTATSGGTVNDKGSPVTIGADSNATAYYTTGYISNFRITKTAVYTSNFTVPTAPLSKISNTALLINNANESGILDESKNGFAVGATANLSSSTTYKFGTNSMYFNGSNYAQVINPSNDLIDWYNYDFTLEYWIYCNSFTSGRPKVIGNMDEIDNSNYWSFGPTSNGTIQMFFWSGALNFLTTTHAISLSPWTHLAFVQNSKTMTIYIDGEAKASGPINTIPLFSSATPLTIGSTFNGYIDDLRITKGYARYLSNFSVPTQELQP